MVERKDNMLDWSLLQNLLIIAIACSSITVIFIQKTKRFCRNSHCIPWYGLLVNLILGFCFSQTFSDIDYIKSIWVGLFSFLGADTIYRNLEGKLASYTDLTANKNSNSDTNASENENSSPSINDSSDDDVIGEITYE